MPRHRSLPFIIALFFLAASTLIPRGASAQCQSTAGTCNGVTCTGMDISVGPGPAAGSFSFVLTRGGNAAAVGAGPLLAPGPCSPVVFGATLGPFSASAVPGPPFGPMNATNTAGVPSPGNSPVCSFWVTRFPAGGSPGAPSHVGSPCVYDSTSAGGGLPVELMGFVIH